MAANSDPILRKWRANAGLSPERVVDLHASAPGIWFISSDSRRISLFGRSPAGNWPRPASPFRASSRRPAASPSAAAMPASTRWIRPADAHPRADAGASLRRGRLAPGAAGHGRPRALPPHRGGPFLNRIGVVAPGFQTTVQDLGRFGYAHLGVSASGSRRRVGLACGQSPGWQRGKRPGARNDADRRGVRVRNGAVIALTGSDFGAGLPLWSAVEIPRRASPFAALREPAPAVTWAGARRHRRPRRSPALRRTC